MPPGVGERLPEARHGTKEAGQEDGAAPAEPVVEGDGEPAADKCAAEVRCRINETEEPGGAGVFAADAELRAVEELGAVYDGFVCDRVLAMCRLCGEETTYPFPAPQRTRNKAR